MPHCLFSSKILNVNNIVMRFLLVALLYYDSNLKWDKALVYSGEWLGKRNRLINWLIDWSNTHTHTHTHTHTRSCIYTHTHRHTHTHTHTQTWLCLCFWWRSRSLRLWYNNRTISWRTFFGSFLSSFLTSHYRNGYWIRLFVSDNNVWLNIRVRINQIVL